MRMQFSENIPLDRITGLQPNLWLSIGSGFNREEVKAHILAQGRGFIADSITTLHELCLKLTNTTSDQILTSTARQEVLRMLLAEPRVLSKMPEIKRMKRRRNFIRRLDASLQAGRLAFAHPQEEEVFEERLNQTIGINPLRGELRTLSQAFDVWCEVSSVKDVPLLIRGAIRILQGGWPSYFSKPEEIWLLSVQNPESLERDFWDSVAQNISVKHLKSLTSFEDNSENFPQLEWQRWHTLDDAAEYFADQIEESVQRSLSLNGSSNGNLMGSSLDGFSDPANIWRENAVLIPDIPAIRRSLRRSLETRGIPLADPRDPTRLRWDELIKWSLLPLELVGRNFERQKVIAWLRGFQMQEEFPAWVTEINSRGIRNGLNSYAGGMLSGVHSRLLELLSDLGGRKTCEEIAEIHLKILRSASASQPERQWLLPFMESTWKVFRTDMAKVGQKERKAPALFWLERIQARLSEASPPIERLKPRGGIQLYRLQQAPATRVSKVWIFGLPPRWLNGDGVGDYWFSERERDLLGLEFAVRSSTHVREERIQVLRSWFTSVESIVILDSQYDSDGREKESILPVLRELEMGLGQTFPDAPEDRGSHSRFTASYQVIRSLQAQEIYLPPLSGGTSQTTASRRPASVAISGATSVSASARPELTATAIERYSRCPFQALAFHRWYLRDIREPDSELWPDIRGNILHEAVRLLLRKMDSEGNFSLSPREALEQAWKYKRPKGLIKSERIERYVQTRLCTILETFCLKEREYVQRSGAQPMSLDEMTLRYEHSEFTMIGQPDRIDQIKDGLFIIDYKTSGTVPNGSEMLEQGYRLQLPFYALASQQKLRRPVLGVQFVELDRKGTRRNGIFFKKYKGKIPGSLTQVRANSKSLVSVDPQDAWSRLESHLENDVKKFLAGEFHARPKQKRREKECSTCTLGDLCGFRRRTDLEEDGGESDV